MVVSGVAWCRLMVPVSISDSIEISRSPLSRWLLPLQVNRVAVVCRSRLAACLRLEDWKVVDVTLAYICPEEEAWSECQG